MESDGLEDLFGYGSDDCSSKSCSDDFEDDHGKEEVNVGKNVESKKGENIVELSLDDFLNKEFEIDEKAYK